MVYNRRLLFLALPSIRVWEALESISMLCMFSMLSLLRINGRATVVAVTFVFVHVGRLLTFESIEWSNVGYSR